MIHKILPALKLFFLREVKCMLGKSCCFCSFSVYFRNIYFSQLSSGNNGKACQIIMVISITAAVLAQKNCSSLVDCLNANYFHCQKTMKLPIQTHID